MGSFFDTHIMNTPPLYVIVRDKLNLVEREIERQVKLKNEGKFPWTCSDTKNLDINASILQCEKLTVLAEEFGEVSSIVCKLMANREESKSVSMKKLHEELIQVAAVCVSWASSNDFNHDD